VAVFRGDGTPAVTDVVAGQSDPPRGWLSRYYGEKVPVPSLAAEVEDETPLTFVSVLSADRAAVRNDGERWVVEAAGRVVGFSLRDGLLGEVAVEEAVTA
jgi:asparagine synthase (glutamine-hydrolysing)